MMGIRDVIVLSTAGTDTALPFGHFEAPLSGGGAAQGSDSGVGKRGSFSGRRRTVLLPDLPLSLLKKIKVLCITFLTVSIRKR